MTTQNTPLMIVCPCCGREIQITANDGGGVEATSLAYVGKEATKEQIAAMGYEFGANVSDDRKLIFNAGIAKSLIRRGNQLVDIKPSKEDPNKTVFVFLVNKKFNSDLASLSK